MDKLSGRIVLRIDLLDENFAAKCAVAIAIRILIRHCDLKPGLT